MYRFQIIYIAKKHIPRGILAVSQKILLQRQQTKNKGSDHRRPTAYSWAPSSAADRSTSSSETPLWPRPRDVASLTARANQCGNLVVMATAEAALPTTRALFQLASKRSRRRIDVLHVCGGLAQVKHTLWTRPGPASYPSINHGLMRLLFSIFSPASRPNVTALLHQSYQHVILNYSTLPHEILNQCRCFSLAQSKNYPHTSEYRLIFFLNIGHLLQSNSNYCLIL